MINSVEMFQEVWGLRGAGEEGLSVRLERRGCLYGWRGGAVCTAGEEGLDVRLECGAGWCIVLWCWVLYNVIVWRLLWHTICF
jgi:hypothetical protein